MSIPAILKQNVPGFKAKNARITQLQLSSGRRGTNEAADESHDKAKQKLGRRKQRRWENGVSLSIDAAGSGVPARLLTIVLIR